MPRVTQTLKDLFFSGLIKGNFALNRQIFIRFLAIIYVMAFASLTCQIVGLIGENGILPAGNYLSHLAESLGWERFFIVPNIFWIHLSDTFLVGLCYVGIVIALLVIFGFWQSPFLLILWFFYLSLVHVTQVFANFQWDILLLEAGFLAIFFAPIKFYSSLNTKQEPNKFFVFALNWLFFRLMFASGLVKLLSKDPTWWDLSALTIHYQTQPIPHIMSWYMHQLPIWFHKFSCALMFVIELAIPFLIFTTKRLRLIASLITIAFMFVIMFTGNYGFFNFLTIALCLTLIDDQYYRKIIPKKLQTKNLENEPQVSFTNRIKNFILTSAALILLIISIIPFAGKMFHVRIPKPAYSLYRYTLPYYITSTYGLFANMTKIRPEIIIEGSQDGTNWQTYKFKWKPQEINEMPSIMIPHMPRLDWQMWFAALSDHNRQPWIINLFRRLLQGQQDVLNLLQYNPFKDVPPKYIRSKLYIYNFTNFDSDNYWKREYIREYTPPLHLNK